jgi:D-beta-D-heptose 7-phosphate kinase/D-beta-D-heptose 1-phosphate adenosyltransferase
MSADLIQLVHNLGHPEVLVLGDVMLDRYVWGDAERVSQEAPVVLLRADRREERLGGASSVATLLRALGARTVLAGVVGNDPDAARVRRLLTEMGIDHDCLLTDPSRPTTVKERYIGRAQARHPQQMLRVDYEIRDPLDAGLEARLSHALASRLSRADVLLVSDYDKGVCTPALLAEAIQIARRLNRRVLVDPIRCKPGSGREAYRKYHGCSAMTPNRLEAGLALDRNLKSVEDAVLAAEELRQRLEMEAGIVTLDKDGMVLAHRDGRRRHFPTRPRQVYDITGAGDMVLCILGLALAAGADYEQAIRLANVAGGLEVEKFGVAPVTRDELLHDLRQSLASEMPTPPRHKIVDRQTLVRELEILRQAGHRIGFTNGCFDLLHAGHVQYLQFARSQVDVLVVGLNSDAGVRALKGPERPINCQTARAEVLAALACVDYVTLFDEETPLELIRLVRPDVLVKGADYTKDQVVGASFVESYGGRVCLAPLKPGYSTSALAARLAASGLRQVA